MKIKKWILKALVQKTISFLPYGHQINFLFQKYVTRGVYLTDDYFFDKLEHGRNHLKGYRKLSGINVPRSCLEIGTGWYPVVPISLFLSGAESIYSVDISPLINKERIGTTLKKFIENERNGKLSNYIAVLPERMTAVENLLEKIKSFTLEEILKHLHITYLIKDARALPLPDYSIELINSNNTFEHIYPDLLIPILKEFIRVANKTNGVMSHFIDMSDHFAHFDKSIHIYNFLQFSDRQWRWIDNSIQPQNRLRIYDYKKIYRDLNIPITEEFFRAGDLDALKSIKTDLRFQNKPLVETAISHCHFYSHLKVNS